MKTSKCNICDINAKCLVISNINLCINCLEIISDTQKSYLDINKGNDEYLIVSLLLNLQIDLNRTRHFLTKVKMSEEIECIIKEKTKIINSIYIDKYDNSDVAMAINDTIRQHSVLLKLYS